MNSQVLSLLIALGACHWICDYIVTTKSMLAAKAKGRPLLPIFDHAMSHVALMGLVLYLFKINPNNLFPMLGLQLFTHFVIDVLKGQCNVLFPSVASPANKIHWVIFGLDQFLHFVVIVLMVKMAY